MTANINTDLSHAEDLLGNPALPLYEKRGRSVRGDVVAIIIGATLVRLLFATLTGVGVDEGYTVATAREIHLGYFDHPPLCWWLTWAATRLFHSEAPALIRLPFIALFALSSGLLYRLTALLFSPKAGFWAVAAFTLAPVFGITTASWILPDGPLVAALLGFMICLVEATASTDGGWRWWLGAGACAGLAMLSKLTALPILAGAVAALLLHPAKRHWLARPQAWVAIALALAMFSPVVVWNAQHHWCSFAFQGGRARALGWHPLAPLKTLGGQALFLLPWIWVALLAGLAAAWRSGRRSWESWLLAWCATPTIAIFALVGVWSNARMLYHWADAGYLMTFPLAGRWFVSLAARHGARLHQIALASAWLVAVAVVGVGAEARWGLLPISGRPGSHGGDADFTLADWSALEPQMRARGWLVPGGPAVAALRWHIAGRLDYALHGEVPVICLGDDPRQYGIAHPAGAQAGRDLLILAPGMSREAIEHQLGASFERIDGATPLYLLHGGRIAMEIPVYIGRSLKR